jgi:hypothetical protein
MVWKLRPGKKHRTAVMMRDRAVDGRMLFILSIGYFTRKSRRRKRVRTRAVPA